MAEGASASSEGAFHTQSTSLRGAVEKIAEAALTGGPAWIGESAPTAGLVWNGDRLRVGTGGRHRIVAARMSDG